MFYNRLLELCDQEHIKPTVLLSKLGMSKGSLANWKDGKLPTGEVLVRFSEHFNVSIDFLVYGKEKDSSTNDEDKEWLSLIHQLPRDAQIEFRGEIKGYLKRMASESVAADEPLKQAK